MIEDPFVLSLLSVVVVSIVSFVGVLTLALKEKTIRKMLVYVVGFAAGALLGDVFIHLLPEITEIAGFDISISVFLLSGILGFFIIEKIVHWHCHTPEAMHKKRPQPVAYMNVLADAIHNFLDGLIIGAAYLVGIPAGIATTIAVVFHEIPQEIGDFGVLLHGGMSKKKALMLNFLTALTAILGVLVSILISNYMSNSIVVLGSFAAGGFIYIAGADLIPELHKRFTTKSAILQTIAIGLGMLAMYVLLMIE